MPKLQQINDIHIFNYNNKCLFILYFCLQNEFILDYILNIKNNHLKENIVGTDRECHTMVPNCIFHIVRWFIVCGNIDNYHSSYEWIKLFVCTYDDTYIYKE